MPLAAVGDGQRRRADTSSAATTDSARQGSPLTTHWPQGYLMSRLHAPYLERRRAAPGCSAAPTPRPPSPRPRGGAPEPRRPCARSAAASSCCLAGGTASSAVVSTTAVGNGSGRSQGRESKRPSSRPASAMSSRAVARHLGVQPGHPRPGPEAGALERDPPAAARGHRQAEADERHRPPGAPELAPPASAARCRSSTRPRDHIGVVARDELRDRAAHRVAVDDRRADPERADHRRGVGGAVGQPERDQRAQARGRDHGDRSRSRGIRRRARRRRARRS